MKEILKIIEVAESSGLFIDLTFNKVGAEVYDFAKQQNLEVYKADRMTWLFWEASEKVTVTLWLN
jgi:hypothetical protein